MKSHAVCWWEAWLDYNVRERTLLTSTKRGEGGLYRVVKGWFLLFVISKKKVEKSWQGGGGIWTQMSAWCQWGLGSVERNIYHFFYVRIHGVWPKCKLNVNRWGGGRECQLNVSRGQGSTMSKICVSWNVVVLKEALAISNDSCAWKYALEVWTAMVQFCVSEFGSRELMRTVHGDDHIWT